MNKLITVILYTHICITSAFGGNQNSFIAINSRSNVLYAGIDNPLIVYFDSLSIDKLNLSCSNGIIFQDSGSLFIIPSRSGRTTILIHPTDNDSIVLFEQDFLVYSLPPPQLYLGEYKADSLPYLTKEILTKNILRIFFTNDILDSSSWLKIKGFTIGYTDGAVYKTLYNEGALITQETFKQLNKIRSGKDISIKVKLISEGNIIRSMPVYTNKLY